MSLNHMLWDEVWSIKLQWFIGYKLQMERQVQILHGHVVVLPSMNI